MSKTKIVCTIGPSSGSPEILEQMVKAGMRVARLNFSHGTHEDHRLAAENVRFVSRKLGVPIAILQDLSGPKIRIGKFSSDPITLKPEDAFVLTSRDIMGDENEVSVSYKGLPRDVRPGDTLLLSDGNLQLKVERIVGEDIFCKVIVGGPLYSHKGINLPTGTMELSAMTKKDEADLEFGIGQGVDYVALSFVRSASDVRLLKEKIKKAGARISVIAKIEKHEAVENLDEIIQEADGIMVARGDLGVEIPFEDVPLVQKVIVRKCNELGKPVITATQMLISMVESPRPSRAEVTDVANAVLDGTDALMLSEETAVGKYPVKAVAAMARIAERIESSAEFIGRMRRREMPERVTVPDAISHAAEVTASMLSSRAIITPTSSGSTARMIARYRPSQPIIAISPNPKTVLQLSLVWGVIPVAVESLADTDDMTAKAKEIAKNVLNVKDGDTAVITAGVPIGVEGTTNLIKVAVF
ncbi:MAG: pyruvate kinase [Thermoplasmata archaeon HGW-Thermoplasmata-1]|nr:MAG: pyruvate kinase [Thermoplasmata archaeon HGW-Thermoplasmata-1]